jgi:hypothetical protein
MKLNKLSYQVEEDEKRSILWFELIIDEKPIGKLIEDDGAIPHYFFEDNEYDLPSYFDSYKNEESYILGVCSCGDIGCGMSQCKIEKDESFVALQVYYPNNYKPPGDIKFKFSRENFDSVISEIRKQAKLYRETIESK